MTRLHWLATKVRRFGELRRALPLAAAALLILSLFLPVWRITLTAPQYMEPLVVELYTYPRIGGDYLEVQTLNHYIGFYYPDPVFIEPNFEVHENAIAVPEWTLGPVVFLAVAACGVFVALAPTERKLRYGLVGQLIGTITVFGGMFVLIQYRLYQAGHSLDPDAPLRTVDSFTPPVLGSYEIANITGHATFGPGGYLAIMAVVLLIIAFFLRKTPARVTDAPTLVFKGATRLPGRIGEVKERVRRLDVTQKGERS